MTASARLDNASPLDLEGETLVDPETAARFLGMTVGTLAKWRVAGKHLRFYKLGRSIRYSPKDLQAFRESIARVSTSQPAPAAASPL